MSNAPVPSSAGRSRLLGAVVLALALLVPLLGAAPAQAGADNTGWSTFGRITYNSQWAAGSARGTTWRNGNLSIASTPYRRTWQGVTYGWADWTSTWVRPGQRFTQLVPSWNARTPAGTWMQLFVRARTTDGRTTRYKDLGRWASAEQGFERGSAGSQADSLARVATDTLVATGPEFTAYQFRVRLMRRDGRDGRTPVTGSPWVRSLHAVVSRLPSSYPATSRPISSQKVLLAVPRYSQMIHEGQDPQYGGGGEAWCSPTSLAMVLAHYDRLPPTSYYSSVPRSWDDRVVNYVARMTYDHTYEGTGNWPFNTGYAATRVMDSFATRLPDLRAAERFLRAGIPVIASIRFGRGQLDGAPISATNGHLVVIVGITRYGNAIVNDPAAPDDRTVLRYYKRGQFEAAWLRGSGGLAYILRDGRHPLPKRPAGLRAW